jgi:hypothetical protein
MKVTKQFILDNRTERGAWTRAQIELLGINWQQRVIGKELNNDEIEQFKKFASVNAKGKTHIERIYLTLINRRKELSTSMIKNMIEQLAKELERR